MPNPSELQRELEEIQAETLELTCMQDFVKDQLDQETVTDAEILDYFKRLNDDPIDEDILCYKVYREEYLRTAREAMENRS